MAQKDLTFNIFGRDVSASKTLDKVGDSVERLDGRFKSFGSGSLKALAGMEAGALGAGAAITGSLGAVTLGFIGAGIALNATSREVGGTWNAMTQEMATDAQSAALPLRGPLQDAILQLTRTSRSLRPEMREAFAATVPAIESLTRGVDGLARTAVPGLVVAVKSSAPAFRGIESAMIDTGHGVKDFFVELSGGARSSEQILVQLGKVVRDALGFAGRFLADLANDGAPSVERLRQVLSQLFSVVSNLSGSGFPVLFTAATAALNVLSGILAAVEPISEELGTLVGVIVSVAAAFRLLNGISTVVSGISTGLQGFVRDVRAAGDEAGGVRNKFNLLTSFIGGPFGIALGIATFALDAFGAKQGEAARRTDDLAAALRASKGAIDDNVRSMAAEKLSKAGAIDQAKKLGINVADLTDAYLGHGKAAEKVTSFLRGYEDQLIAQGVPLQENAADTKKLVDEMESKAAAARALLALLDEEAPKNEQSRQAALDLALATDESRSSLEHATLAQKNHTAATAELRAAYMTLQDEVGNTNARLSALQTIMDRLTGRKPDYEEAIQSLNDTFRSLGDQYESTKGKAGEFGDALVNADGTVNTSTEAGSRLQDTMVALQSSTLSAADAMARNGATQQEVQGFVEGVRQQFIKQRTDMGYTQEAAEALANKYGLLPRDVTTLFFTPNLGDRMQAIDAFRAKVETLPDGHVIVYADTAGAQGSIDRVISTNDGRVVNITIKANGDVQALNASGQAVGWAARAQGGPVLAGKPYLVGERGPELIFPTHDGYVANAQDTAAIMRGARTESVRMGDGSGAMVSKTYNLTVYNAANSVVDIREQFRRMELMQP
ncbi:hypothetical protein [Saccharothrix variisporea]|uniref:Uncharacterized protein n=1 Tax=Saccharothrix variisporea TaxID=543527 RepID=A0A495X1H3_9PSEU|nr:hypothetical protein [Saccharothrix variisporea]RKT67115.1 hypothetical protein DFJ66_0283 [Saccharothrix variisporea]